VPCEYSDYIASSYVDEINFAVSTGSEELAIGPVCQRGDGSRLGFRRRLLGEQRSRDDNR
jgi:hypothetical protein